MHGASPPQFEKNRVTKYTFIHETFKWCKVMQSMKLKSYFQIYKQCPPPFLDGDKACL